MTTRKAYRIKRASSLPVIGGSLLLIVLLSALWLSVCRMESLLAIEVVTHDGWFDLKVPINEEKRLISPDLSVESLRVRGDIEHSPGPCAPRAKAAGYLVLEPCRTDRDGIAPFRPELTLFRDASIHIEQRSRQSGSSITIELGFPGATADDHVAKVTVNNKTIAVLRGGTRAGLDLAIAGRLRPKSSTLQVMELATGKLLSSATLDLDPLPERLVLPHQEQLLVLEGRDEEHRSLGGAGDLSVSGVRFHQAESSGAVSEIVYGKVRYPTHIKDPVEIEPGTFLLLAEEDELTLRSIGLAPSGLRLELLGKPESIALGPNPQYPEPLQPTWLQWIFFRSQTERIGLAVSSVLTFIALGFKLLKG